MIHFFRQPPPQTDRQKITPFKPKRPFKRYRIGIRRTPWRRIERIVAGSAFPADCMQFMLTKRMPMTGPESM